MNRIKEKNHVIVSVDVEKVFDKIEYLSMIIKTLNKWVEGNFLNLIKSIYQKPTANVTVICRWHDHI